MIAMLGFTALAIFALCSAISPNIPRAGKIALVFMAPLLFRVGFLIGSSVGIDADQTGIVIKHVGTALSAGQIVARQGEQGPQAAILSPGWHFGTFPSSMRSARYR